MADFFLQRCRNHAAREAAARCPECGQFFCRECITEFHGRVICAVCVQKLAAAPAARRPVLAWIGRLIQCGVGILVAWFFFFLVGERLLRLPASFHDQTLWQVPWIDEE